MAEPTGRTLSHTLRPQSRQCRERVFFGLGERSGGRKKGHPCEDRSLEWTEAKHGRWLDFESRLDELLPELFLNSVRMYSWRPMAIGPGLPRKEPFKATSPRPRENQQLA